MPTESQILKKFDFIDVDLQSRELQWNFLGEPAPCLSQDSAAYRFAGFGTHEVAVYYELLRRLLSECWGRVSERRDVPIADEVARLKQIKAGWLEYPHLAERNHQGIGNGPITPQGELGRTRGDFNQWPWTRCTSDMSRHPRDGNCAERRLTTLTS